MKKTLLLTIACLITVFLQAQDTLYRVDGTRQVVMIIEVTFSQVRYNLIDNSEGLVFVLDKQAVAKITYEDGKIDTFRAISDPEDSSPSLVQDKSLGKNLLSLNMIELVAGSISFSYERLSSSGMWGWKFPVSIGYRDWPESSEVNFLSLTNLTLYSSQRVKYSGGLAFNYYHNHDEPEKRNWFIGLAFIYGKNKNINDPLPVEDKFFYYGISGGDYYKISRNLDAAFQSGLGIINAKTINNFVFHVEINLCFSI